MNNEINSKLFYALATKIAEELKQGNKITSRKLKRYMDEVFGEGSLDNWSWKWAYEIMEIAQLLVVRDLFRSRGNIYLEDVINLEKLVPPSSIRDEDTVKYQQFSAPLTIAFLMAKAGQVRMDDIVLEPSAGLGNLVFWQSNEDRLILNELSSLRYDLLKEIYPNAIITDFNAETINDRLPQGYRPNLILMNPPFSANPNIDRKRYLDATPNHLKSALLRLAEGGRLVCLTFETFNVFKKPDLFKQLELETGTKLVATFGIDGKFYRKKGTNAPTRIHVFDKTTEAITHLAFNENVLSDLKELDKAIAYIRLREKSEGYIIPDPTPEAEEVVEQVKPKATVKKNTIKEPKVITYNTNFENSGLVEYSYQASKAKKAKLKEGIYEKYASNLKIKDAKPHPTSLVQSLAMASVGSPKPSYQPTLPEKVVSEGILSDAQIESLIYAGESHQHYLDTTYRYEEQRNILLEENDGIQYRQGWFLGDGTGVGKGRQIAGIILDNYLKGRKKAIWLSASSRLVHDAQESWEVLGGDPKQIIPLSNFKQGEKINLVEGIIFATYATLRTAAKENKVSRVQQLVEWVGEDFDGVIVFDESHAMQNATTKKSTMGLSEPSQQGVAGLKLQRLLPKARVVYSSATGATEVINLAYAERLGLWSNSQFPFKTRENFISQMEAAGVAGMEVICRDLKTLGLYTARSLSFDGVRYEILQHDLTPEQQEIYNTYAECYQLIHSELEKVLEITDAKYNRQARVAAYSVFEATKQRFFSHIISSMKCPTLIKSIEEDLAKGESAIIQLDSTNEALLNRRLGEIPASEWDDVTVDITPREYVLDYLDRVFPTALYDLFTDENGKLQSEIATTETGAAVVSQEAEAIKQSLMEKVLMLPALPSALDQIIWYFGTDRVAEVTGRKLRLVKKIKKGCEVYAVDKRGSNANYQESESFMNDEKQILIFSRAGGTGATYSASLDRKNQRIRNHYLQEAGWKADIAIQGIGRSHRSNQAQPPLYRLVTTNIKGEKRFISTIARRLDTLGALTKGQRQTGGQGIFKAEDNLESVWAKSALTTFYRNLYLGAVKGWDYAVFNQKTGLVLTDSEGGLKADLPPITTFLNRLLALTIEDQNYLFSVFDDLLHEQVETAIAKGMYEQGIETLKAEKIVLLDKRLVYSHSNGGETYCYELELHEKAKKVKASKFYNTCKLIYNSHSKKVAAAQPIQPEVSDSGAIIPRYRVIRPNNNKQIVTEADLFGHYSKWEILDQTKWTELWNQELAEVDDIITRRIYLVCGLLLPVWAKISAGASNVKVWRLQTECGLKLLGRLVDDPNNFYLALGLEGVKLHPDMIYDEVYKKGESVSNGEWRLKRTFLNYDYRLELVAEKFNILKEKDHLRSLGCIIEVINYQARIFIPIDKTKAVSIIRELF